MSVEVVQGQVRTVLHSGGDVRVRSGTARIDLVEGGQISICGPAHLSVLKSGGWLTIALHTRTIHLRIEDQRPLNISTPQIQAPMVAILDGPRDAAAFFVLIGSSIHLRRRPAQWAGELKLPKATPPRLEARGRATAGEGPNQAAAEKPKAQPETVAPPLAKEEPIYQVFMPPLVYDA